MTYALLIVDTDVPDKNLPTEWHTFAGPKEQHECRTEDMKSPVRLFAGASLWNVEQSWHDLSLLLAALCRYECKYQIAFLAEKPEFCTQ